MWIIQAYPYHMVRAQCSSKPIIIQSIAPCNRSIYSTCKSLQQSMSPDSIFKSFRKSLTFCSVIISYLYILNFLIFFYDSDFLQSDIIQAIVSKPFVLHLIQTSLFHYHDLMLLILLRSVLNSVGIGSYSNMAKSDCC